MVPTSTSAMTATRTTLLGLVAQNQLRSLADTMEKAAK
jgi:hypothetical protein